MRRLLPLLVLTLLGLARPAEAAPAVVERVVHDGVEYRQAIEDLSADDTAPHRIVLADDIVLGRDPVPEYTSARPLTLDGRGHTLRGRVPWFLRGNDAAPRLTVRDVVMTGAAAGIAWIGDVDIRDSAFVHLGRGYELFDTSPAVSTVGFPGRSAVARLTDVDIVDTRSNVAPLYVVGTLFGTRLRVTGNDGGGVIETRGRLHLVDSVVDRNLVRRRAVVGSRTRSVELVGTAVTRNRRLLSHGVSAPVVQAATAAVLVRSVIAGSDADTSATPGVALQATRLEARSAVIRHHWRACSVSGATRAAHSVASDRSCGF
jgi:hypothetical protein